MSTTTATFRDVIPDTRSLVTWAAVLNAEAILVLGYVLNTAQPATDPFLLLFPFIWLNIAGLVVLRVRPELTSRRRTLGSAVLALGYLLVLGYVGGVYGTGGQGTGFRLVTQAPPGSRRRSCSAARLSAWCSSRGRSPAIWRFRTWCS